MTKNWSKKDFYESIKRLVVIPFEYYFEAKA